ncbi:flagellar motor protein MotB [Clostridium sp.]|uniref:flagellar motor protein MotB n=1 Tax=Clostridium sp. TaxID=1506 RepID=UPI002FC67A23
MKNKKKVHHEEHVDETWLIPYADMLTLLLALFIVMFAMSQVDKEKFEKVSTELNAIFSSSNGILQDGGIEPVEDLHPEVVSNGVIEENKMQEIKETIEEEIGKNGYSDKVKVELNEGGLEISIQDVLLFNSGDAKVLDEVTPLLLQISNMLKSLDNDIKIVGHTDNVPIHNTRFPSNWELSATRAINVMNFIVNTGGVNPKKLSIQAYGEQMPKFDNSTKEGREKNRRVEIFIIRNYSSPSSNSKEN